MDNNRINHKITDSRNKTINRRLFGILSGTLLGIAAFLIKIAVSTGVLNIEFFINPITWIALILAIVGFLLMQKAFYYSSISTVISTIAGLSIIIPIILAHFFLSETINPIGIILILLGVIMIGLSKKA
ncbi:MAG: hypothetical protein V1870_00330 [Candidatus Aenigmatarchaeota archaeon]